MALQSSRSQSADQMHGIYTSFVAQYLGTPQILKTIGDRETILLAKTLSPPLFVAAIVDVSSADTVSPASQLWILGHFLLLVELSGQKTDYLKQPSYVQTLAQLLRNSSRIKGFVPMRWSSIGAADEDDEDEEEEEDAIMKE